MITKSAYIQYAPRPNSTTLTNPCICRLVYDDGTASQWFLTKVKGIQFIETALDVGAITSEEELILKQQVLQNDALYACHPNIDQAAAQMQEADGEYVDGDQTYLLFVIFMADEDGVGLSSTDDSEGLALAR